MAEQGSEREYAGVVYAAPRRLLASAITMVILAAFSTFGAVTLICVGLIFARPQLPPVPVITGGIAVLVGAGYILVRYWRRRITRFIVIDEEAMHASGIFWSSRAPLDAVVLLRLRGPSADEPDQPLWFEATSEVGTIRVMLARSDAHEAFHAARELCPRAAALDAEDEGYAPLDVEGGRSSRLRLVSAMRRRGRGFIIGGAILAIGGATMLVIPSGGQGWSILLGAVGAGVPFMMRGRTLLRRSAELAPEEEPADEVGHDDRPQDEPIRHFP